MSAIESLRASLHQQAAKLQDDLKPALEAAAQRLRSSAEEASAAAARASAALSHQLLGWCQSAETMAPDAVGILRELARKHPSLQQPLSRLEERVPHLNVVLPAAAALLLLVAAMVASRRYRAKRGAEKTVHPWPDVKQKLEAHDHGRHAPAPSARAPPAAGGHHGHLQLDDATLDLLAEKLYRILQVEPFAVTASQRVQEAAPAPPPSARGAAAPSSSSSSTSSSSSAAAVAPRRAPSVKKTEQRQEMNAAARRAGNVSAKADKHETDVDGSNGDLKNSDHAHGDEEEEEERAVMEEDGAGKQGHEE